MSKISKEVQTQLTQLRAQLKASNNTAESKELGRTITQLKSRDLSYKTLSMDELYQLTLTQLKDEMAKTGAPQIIQEIYNERKVMLRLRSQARSLQARNQPEGQGLTPAQSIAWVSDANCGDGRYNMLLDMYQMHDTATAQWSRTAGSDPASNIRDGGHSMQHVWLYQVLNGGRLPNSGSHQSPWSVAVTKLANEAKDPDDIVQMGCVRMLNQVHTGNRKPTNSLTTTLRNLSHSVWNHECRNAGAVYSKIQMMETEALVGNARQCHLAPMVQLMQEEHAEQIQERVMWLRDDLDEEKAWLLEALMCGYTHKECGDELGKSTKTIQRWVKTLELSGVQIMQYA